MKIKKKKKRKKTLTPYVVEWKRTDGNFQPNESKLNWIEWILHNDWDGHRKSLQEKAGIYSISIQSFCFFAEKISYIFFNVMTRVFCVQRVDITKRYERYERKCQSRRKTLTKNTNDDDDD